MRYVNLKKRNSSKLSYLLTRYVLKTVVKSICVCLIFIPFNLSNNREESNEVSMVEISDDVINQVEVYNIPLEK